MCIALVDNDKWREGVLFFTSLCFLLYPAGWLMDFWYYSWYLTIFYPDLLPSKNDAVVLAKHSTIQNKKRQALKQLLAKSIQPTHYWTISNIYIFFFPQHFNYALLFMTSIMFIMHNQNDICSIKCSVSFFPYYSFLHLPCKLFSRTWLLAVTTSTMRCTQRTVRTKPNHR